MPQTMQSDFNFSLAQIPISHMLYSDEMLLTRPDDEAEHVALFLESYLLQIAVRHVSLSQRCNSKMAHQQR